MSAGNVHDSIGGFEVLETIGKLSKQVNLLMDRAYEGFNMRKTAFYLNFKTIVPPKENRKNKWGYDKELYKRRNEVERLFRKLKDFRRIFTRYDKLDRMFVGFIQLALIFIALR